MAAKEPKCSHYSKLDTWEESRSFLKLTRIQEYQGGYGNIRHTYKDDWNSEDEDLLAEVLSGLNFFSAEKRTSASSKEEFSGGYNLNEDMEDVKLGGAKITLIRDDKMVSPSLVRSASEYLFLPLQDSFPEETFQEGYAMKHVEELSVQDELEVTRSEKTDRLNKRQTTPSYPIDNIDQSTMEALGQDVRKMEDMSEEKTLRDMKDGADLRDAIMKYESVRDETNITDENEDMELMNEREENSVSDEEDGEEKKVWEEIKEEEEKEENSERDKKDEEEENDLEKGMKDVSKDEDLREEDVRPEKSMRRNEDAKEERETEEIERGEDFGNESEVGDPIWTRISRIRVTRKAWKVPVTSATKTGDGGGATMHCLYAVKKWSTRLGMLQMKVAQH